MTRIEPLFELISYIYLQRKLSPDRKKIMLKISKNPRNVKLRKFT